jgi:hypothetical protein
MEPGLVEELGRGVEYRPFTCHELKITSTAARATNLPLISDNDRSRI